MADLLKRTERTKLTWLVRVGIAVVVVAVVAALAIRGVRDDDRDTGPVGAGPTSATPSAAPTQVDPDTFCEQFRKFADAQAQYVAAPQDPMAEEALVEAADTLLGLGRPRGLSEGGLISLRMLVDGALGQAGDETDVPTEGTADQPALDAYLADSCPA